MATSIASASAPALKPLTATQIAEAREKAEKNADKLKGGLVKPTPALTDYATATKLASAINAQLFGDRFEAYPETGMQHVMDVLPNRAVNQDAYVPTTFEFNADSVTVTKGTEGFVVPYEHKTETMQDLFKAAVVGWEVMNEATAPSPMLTALHRMSSKRPDPVRALLSDSFSDFKMQSHPNPKERIQYSLSSRGEFIDVTFREKDNNRETDLITIEGPKGTVSRELTKKEYSDEALLAEVAKAVAQYQARK